MSTTIRKYSCEREISSTPTDGTRRFGTDRLDAGGKGLYKSGCVRKVYAGITVRCRVVAECFHATDIAGALDTIHSGLVQED
jgi:hypothetical protein